MKAEDKQRWLAKFNGNSPSDAEAVRQHEAELHLTFPDEYAQFLISSNGGEGFIGPNAYVMFWRVEDLLKMNKAYQVSEYAPGLFLFGSDGGGEAFAFDTRVPAKPIVSVPFVGMEIRYIRPIAPTFNEFLEKLFQS